MRAVTSLRVFCADDRGVREHEKGGGLMAIRHWDRRDKNQAPIVEALRKAGAVVWEIRSTGARRGLPDLMCGYAGRTWLLEVKQPGGKLSPEQERFAGTWRGGPVATVTTPEEALAAVGIGAAA